MTARSACVAAALAAGVCMPAAWAGGCTLGSGGLAFGAYQPLALAGKVQSVDRTSDATVTLVCSGITTGGSYSIALGPSAGGGMYPRTMSHPLGGPDMVFNIYLDPAFSAVWGDGGTGSVLSGVIPGGNSTQSHTVYGRIPAGQNRLRAGSHSATLTMTVTYNP